MKLASNLVTLLLSITVPACLSKTIFINHGNHGKPDDETTRKPTTTLAPSTTQGQIRDISIGPCTWVINRKCPDSDIKFFLYTRQNPMDRQCVHIDANLEKSNLTNSFFNPELPTKIIIHGYNSDMFLSPLQMMTQAYLKKGSYNLFYVDWSILSPGPCYISAVHNTRHAGACVAQLVERIVDTGSRDIHVIGFSLGAQLTNYIAQNLDSFLLPRITGLDPALPLFITANPQDKLDETDAAYVDVIHTNALVQGKLERCGHADFYMNGGIIQPGCNSQGSNPFACSHQRAPAYFLESINTRKGFYGWACSSYLSYLLGMCPPTNYLVEAGDNIRHSTKGMFLINTNDTAPYALGKWTDLPMLGAKQPTLILTPPKQHGDPLLKQVDQWGKLDSNFNNIEDVTTDFSFNNPNEYGWTNYVGSGSTVGTVLSTSEFDDSIEEQDVWHSNLRSNNNEADPTSSEIWNEYKRNLSFGFIDNSIFKIPQIKGIVRNSKRG